MPRSLTFIIPGTITEPTGGYEYDRQVIARLRDRGWAVDVQHVSDTFPNPSAAALGEAAHALARVPDNGLVMIDGLAFGAMPELAVLHARRLRLVALVHLPLALEVGIDAASAARFEASERRALAAASLIVATGTTTVDELASRFDAHSDRVVLIEPGTVLAPLAAGSGDPDCLHLLCVGTVSQRKGHDVLVDALARIPHLNWMLTCAGSLDRDRSYAALLHERIKSAALESRVTVEGTVDSSRLIRLYDTSDVFAFASRYETYGMAVAEALARGLPIIATRTGAIGALAGDEAGLLVDADNVDALANALTRVIVDGPLREQLRAGARRARLRLPTWDQAIDRFVTAFDRVSHDEPIVF